jgi:catecholate siderophore receptor
MQRQISKGDVDSDYSIETTAFSVMDTIDFNEYWSLFLGLRADHFDYTNDVGSTDPVEWAYSDTLINGHAGLVYNIHDDANVYLTYSTASEINGGESDLGANCGYGGLCGSVGIVEDSEPENVENIELGTKWNLFDEKLLVSAAIFRITKDDVMESANGYDYDSLGFLNTGEHRVDGVELTLTGNITDKLSTQFGITTMNAKILESYTETNEGLTLANFSDNSMNLQLRYELTPEFAFGGSASYYSEKYVGQPDSAANEDLEVPSYTVYDLFATYQISKDLGARLNIGNITDEDYYLTAYRSGAFAYIGDRRNAQLTLTYEF